jgi:hypothetical protein
LALDGTKVCANASKHKAMSYGRMPEAEARLKREVRAWFKRAATSDAAEDREHGARRGDELPDWVADKQARLEKIRAARVALEAEARAAGKTVPEPKAQRNFTDPDSRIMKSGKDFVQAYNAQAAVDHRAQVIVTQSMNNSPTDVQQLAPIVAQIKHNMGRQAHELSADAGYCSEGNLAVLARGGRRSRYRLRKTLPEPVFGQIKQARGFRQFLLRGVEKVRGEWSLICTVHNLLKLAQAAKPS